MEVMLEKGVWKWEERPAEEIVFLCSSMMAHPTVTSPATDTCLAPKVGSMHDPKH